MLGAIFGRHFPVIFRTEANAILGINPRKLPLGTSLRNEGRLCIHLFVGQSAVVLVCLKQNGVGSCVCVCSVFVSNSLKKVDVLKNKDDLIN